MLKRTAIKPLLQLSNRLFSSQPLYFVQKSPELDAVLNRIDSNNIRWKAFNDRTNSEYYSTIHEMLRVDWTYNSCAIEGSQVTREDTFMILDQGISVSGRPMKDIFDTHGHSEAIDWLFDTLPTATPISQHFVNSLNQLLVGHVKKVPALTPQGRMVEVPFVSGRYRSGPTVVRQPDGSLYEYVPAYLIDAHMTELFDFCNNPPAALHPVMVAALAHYNFVRIHPHQDGNGRGARLLMNYLLLKQGMPPCVVLVSQRAEYLKALRLADEGDASVIVKFIADSVDETLDSVIKVVKEGLKLEI